MTPAAIVPRAERVVGRQLGAAVARLDAVGIPTARQDAEILLARLLGTSRLALRLEPGREVAPEIARRFEASVARRAGHEPLQYLLGEAEFLDLRIAVGPGVFIPRPETEVLVERALGACPAGARLAVDLCTGSGAVACALALRRPGLRVVAVELSALAAAWARANVERLGLGGRVRVVEGDLVAPLAECGLGAGCDLMVGNPPYIAGPALPTLPAEVREFEPWLALDGGPAGTAVIERILAAAPAFMRPATPLLLEVGEGHAGRMAARVARDPRYARVALDRDHLGHPRVLEAWTR